jgi:hypothetical protein
MDTIAIFKEEFFFLWQENMLMYRKNIATLRFFTPVSPPLTFTVHVSNLGSIYDFLSRIELKTLKTVPKYIWAHFLRASAPKLLARIDSVPFCGHCRQQHQGIYTISSRDKHRYTVVVCWARCFLLLCR